MKLRKTSCPSWSYFPLHRGSAVWQTEDARFTFERRDSAGWRIYLCVASTKKDSDFLKRNGLFLAPFRTRREAIIALELALNG